MVCILGVAVSLLFVELGGESFNIFCIVFHTLPVPEVRQTSSVSNLLYDKYTF
jgi:hypothetical protein